MTALGNYFLVGLIIATIAAIFDEDERTRLPQVFLGIVITWPIYIGCIARDAWREITYRYQLWQLRRELVRLGREIGGPAGQRIIETAKKLTTPGGING